MKKKEDWPAIVEQLKNDRLEKRNSVSTQVRELNKQIDAIKKKREEITKSALEGFVVGTLNQAKYQDKINEADKLWGELRPLIDARDEMIKTGKDIVDEDEKKMLPDLVASINDVTAEIHEDLEGVAQTIQKLYPTAVAIARNQDARAELHRMFRASANGEDPRTFGLKIDEQVNKVLQKGTTVQKFWDLISWTAREMESSLLFDLELPEYL